MFKFTVSKTFETWDEDDIEHGGTDYRGFEYQDEQFSLRELLDEIKHNGFVEPAHSWLEGEKNKQTRTYNWLKTVDADENYQTGEKTYYGLHIKTTGKRFYKICQLAGLTKQ